MRIPIAEVQKQIEAETEQTVSGAPTYHAGSSEWVEHGGRLTGYTPSTGTQRSAMMPCSQNGDYVDGKGYPYYGAMLTGEYISGSADATFPAQATDRNIMEASGGIAVTFYYPTAGQQISMPVYWMAPVYTTTDSMYMGGSIRNFSPTSGTSGDCSYSFSVSGQYINYTITSDTPHARFDISYSYEILESTPGYYTGITRTIDLGEDKFVTAVSVVSKSPSGATVTPTKTEHGASVYLYQNSSSTITATIKLEYYYYETVKEAKVKHNGTIYRHIKYNSEIVV